MKKTLDIKKDFSAWVAILENDSEEYRKGKFLYEHGMITFSELMAVAIDEARNLRWNRMMDIE